MSSPAIEIEQLVKRFGNLTAVNGIDLQIAAGECVAVLGPNGAGKTTTIEILEGIQQPTSGKVRVLGRSWETDAGEIRRRIGVQLQQTTFPERATVEELVRLFHSFHTQGLEVEEAIKLVHLEEKRRTWVSRLSGGQAQRLALALAMIGDPELVFLDEPTTGLDPQSRRSLWDIIDGLKTRGRTVILTTHYLEEAQRLADRVVIIDHGKVVAQGSPAQLIASLGGDQVIEFASEPPLPPEVLAALPGFVSATNIQDRTALSVQALHVTVPALLQEAERRGAKLLALSTRAASLDDVFLAITGRSLRDN